MTATPSGSRFIIGIDLGTTNSALAYIDTQSSRQEPQMLPITQWEMDQQLTTATTLPSFYYLPPKTEWKKGQLNLPHHVGGEPADFAVGRFARWRSSQVPGRVVHAAKSWLTHAGVDRTARILPWHVGDLVGDERRSPVEVSAAYLAHLRAAWEQHPDLGGAGHAFAVQDVVLTVPASFDEAAQRLTLEAAAMAGYPLARTRLLEEPQAAFYHWLQSAPGRQQKAALDGTILICDVGGGTSDFSLFTATPGPAGPVLERTAVSDHLLLGGDNIDLSIAHRLEQQLAKPGHKLSSRQWAQLVFAVRQLKEIALTASPAAAPAPPLHVAIAGEGASLLAQTVSASIAAEEVTAAVLDGFFPVVARDAQPQRPRAALLQLGLPYAQDTALTRHLAAFLAGRQVDWVLFTGGSLKPAALRSRLLAQLTQWQGQAPQVLAASDHDLQTTMDLAVALGAAAYGLSSREPASRIRGGYPRSLYLEVAGHSGAALLCIVPQGYDGLEPLRLSELKLQLRLGQPVRFQLFSSNRRPAARFGELTAFKAGHFHPLPAVATQLHAAQGHSGAVPVELEARMADTGLFQLYCVHRQADGEEQRWQLDFNLRSAPSALAAGDRGDEPAVSPALDSFSQEQLTGATALLTQVFGKKRGPGSDVAPSMGLVRELENLIGKPREDWPTALLRSLWLSLEPGLTRRSRSLGHELTWLYLAGYALRPGYGFELDEWRMQELWRCFDLGLAFPKERQVEDQWWLMWRRVAGGLNRAQQERLFDRIFPLLRKNEAASGEIYMLAGSLELIEMTQKMRLGQQLVQQLAGGRQQFVNQRAWALARVASRVPLYGGPAATVRPEVVSGWFEELRTLRRQDPAFPKLALFLAQAGRMVGDRELDLDDRTRQDFIKRLHEVKATPEQIQVVREWVPVDLAARSQLFGESLPAGLSFG